jgi:hypothetical protein
MKKNNLATICIALTLGAMSSCGTSKKNSMNNMVARMEVKEPIAGVCDNTNVIVVLPFPGNGQVEAKGPKTDAEITTDLNSRVVFLKDKPDYEDKGTVSLIINCKGELVQCQISNKSKSAELDSQIVAIFAELKTWTAGTIQNKPIDTVILYSFTITNGKITIS